MSTLVPIPEVAATRPSKWRRGGRTSLAGTALVSRGEPMVWLTGGALAVALTMILGLLTLVLLRGIVTFWPVPIRQVELLDGSRVMGEVTESESYTLTPAMLGDYPEPIAAAAQTELAEATVGSGGQPSIQADRRLFRTGNFDLTSTHFRWVSDFEIAPGSESTPGWAVLLERTEWGRFYGEPQQFTLRHVRLASGEEEQLRRIADFLAQNAFLLPEDRQAVAQASIDAVTRDLDTARRKNIERFIERLPAADSSARREVVLDSGETVDRKAVEPDQNVTAVHDVWTGPEPVWQQFERHHDDVRERFARIRSLEKHDIGAVNHRLEQARLAVRQAELDTGDVLLPVAEMMASIQVELAALEKQESEGRQLVRQIERRYGQDSDLGRLAHEMFAALQRQLEEQRADPVARLKQAQTTLAKSQPSSVAAVERFLEASRRAADESARIATEITSLVNENARFQMSMATADGQEKELVLGEIVRAYPANQLSLTDKLSVYFSRWGEFLADDPREANSEGGVFPAIWGTVTMTLIMSLAVVPFGVLAALYLREYAKAGFIVSAVRVSVNNLAGVPSIVFGVFGLGFFCYVVGAYVDGGPRNAGIAPWPGPQWFLAAGGLAVLAVAAFLCGMFSFVRRKAEAPRWKRIMGRLSLVLWLVATGLLVLMIAYNPFFDGFFAARVIDGSPTYGKGALIWASLTLALMTLPVVIVATEEALSAVPNSMREGSYACGASKWQTIRRIVLPRAMPGIMTGMILAMARGAGEVAPLMLVGAVKLAPELPLDTMFPFLHPDRSFMHLGFHIYDLGFQSQNSEAAKPMVFTTTLLLIALIATLNLAAIWLRGRLRRRFQSAQF